MSHAVEFFEFPYKTKESEIYNEISDWGAHNADYEETGGHYHGNFKLLPNKEFKTRKEAEDYLDSLGSYVDRGVIFYKYPTADPTSQMKKIEDQIKKLEEQAIKYATDHSVQQQKASYIGCSLCGSKVNKEYLIKGYEDRLKTGKMAEADWKELTVDGVRGRVYYFQHFGQKCPVCQADLRASYIKEKLDEYSIKLNDLFKKQQELKTTQNEKNFKKAEKYWLCKAEVHC